jgi:heptosyltransferase III
MSRPKIFRYLLNQKLRWAAHWAMRLLIWRWEEQPIDLHHQELERILIVRATFRLGDSILAIPAILWFRKLFPHARIDFLGAPISAKLFENLPIDNCFTITRRYPGSGLDYPRLLRKLRLVGYDLAVDVSCSQSAMGSFLIGLSGARFKVGLKGKWDQWFNVRIPRPSETNKYKILPAFLRNLGLEADVTLPSVALAKAEIAEARQKFSALLRSNSASKTVAVFVGGRKGWDKRWPIENFCQVITALRSQGLNVLTFVGPEEKDSVGYFRDALGFDIPLVFEPSIRAFAAMIANCDLFVTCDSGPMHMACGLGIHTVAIFQHLDFNRWGPPSSIARVVFKPGGPSAMEVFRACLEELSIPFSFRLNGHEAAINETTLTSIPEVSKTLSRLEKSLRVRRALFVARFAQAVFAASLLIHAWFFPQANMFVEGSWPEELTDVLGVAATLLGGFLRVWAASHRGRWANLYEPEGPLLVTTGPYGYIRHPLYIANLLIGVGFVFLSGAFPLALILLSFFVVYHLVLIPGEEDFLKERFGKEFDLYCETVPRYVPIRMPWSGLSLGNHFPGVELATIWLILAATAMFEWLESPVHRTWILGLSHWIRS